MRISVVGCGSIGTRHLRNLLDLGVPAEDMRAVDIRVNPIHTPEIAERGVDIAWLGRELKISDIGTPEALLICTPASQHDDLIAYAQYRRIPFFVEKPAALATEVSFAWDCDLPHLVGCNLRFRPELLALRSQAHDATHGTFVCQQDTHQWPGRAYAHPVFEFCHEIDLALWMFGPALSMDCAIVDHLPQLHLTHAHATSTIRIGHAAGESLRTWALDREGTVLASYIVRGPLVDVNDMYRDEMAHFLRVVRGEEPSINTLADAKRVVAICEHATTWLREVA